MPKERIVTSDEIGARIRSRRRRARWQPEELAAAIGVQAVLVVRWEDGVYAPDLEQAQRLASALGCSVEDFVSRPQEDAFDKIERAGEIWDRAGVDGYETD